MEQDIVNEGSVPVCSCQKCFNNRTKQVTGLVRSMMILCPVCGNKRCPHANDHLNTCSGSNELGQVGSK